MGAIEQTIIKQALRSGQPIPDRIANAPKLRYGLNLYLMAFFDLDSERQVGFGPSRISWSAIKEYAEAYELDDYQTDSLFYLIRKMDTAYLGHMKEKQAT